MCKHRIWLPILIVGMVILAGGAALRGQVAHALPPAQAPAAGITIPYPGSLHGADDSAAADGAYSMAFGLYDAAAGGTLVWTETQEGVPVAGGAFLVTLGSVQPIPAAALAGGSLWLEVAVRGPADAALTTLAPRQQLREAQPGAAIDAGAPCAHDHVGETWTMAGPVGDAVLALTGDSSGTAFYVSNANTNQGDGIRIYSHGADNSGALWASNLAAGYGVRGGSVSGVGVYGTSNANDAVAGETAAAGKSGVYGHHTGDASNLGFGVTGRSSTYFGMLAWGNDAGLIDATGDLLLQGSYGEIMAEGILNIYSNDDIYADLDNNGDSDSCFIILNGADDVVWQVCEAKGMQSWAPLSSVVQTAGYGDRAVYAVQSPEVWLEDYGTAGLVGGEATVAIDPVFAQGANTRQEYHVYVTALSEEPVLLYVAAKTPTSFTVRGALLDGRPAGCSFDYRIVARQVGYEGTRLEQVEQGGK